MAGFWKLNVMTFDEPKKEKNNQLFPVRKENLPWVRFPPALLPHHLDIALLRIWIINKVKFCYFNIDMQKKFTFE